MKLTKNRFTPSNSEALKLRTGSLKPWLVLLVFIFKPVLGADMESDRTSQNPVNSEALPRLLEAAGYTPDPSFKAYIIAFERKPDGNTIQHRFDYKGTSLDRDNWWPASMVKLYAAVAALEVLHAHKFSPKASITFHYEDGDVTQTITRLVRQAITPSNNAAFDRLVEIVGFDAMNQWFQIKGIKDTVFLRSYTRRVVDETTNLGTPRESSAYTVTEGSKTWKVPARIGDDKVWHCPNQGNCTTLQSLAEILRRVMMHEQIPDNQRLNLGRTEIRLLRSALSGKRTRGLGVVNGLKAGFEPHQIKCFNKPGYAYQWFSDHVFVSCQDCKGPVTEWIVAMAGHGGRDVLDEAAKIVGQILAKGSLMDGARKSGGTEDGEQGQGQKLGQGQK
mgnify:CR=1 FL=1